MAARRRTWRLAYDADDPIPAEPQPAPIAGLVTVGTRDGAAVLVNLEAFGRIAVTGDPARAENLARAIVLEIATSEELANACCTTVGIPLEGHEPFWRVETGDVELARGRLAEHTATYRRLLDETGLATAFQTRLGEANLVGDVCVVLVGSEESMRLDDVIVKPNSGVALVTLADAATDGASIEITADGTATLQPSGLTFHATGIALAVASEIAVLLANAADTTAAEAADPETDATTSIDLVGAEIVTDEAVVADDLGAGDIDDPDPEAPEPSHLIRVLGPPRIDGFPNVGRLELGIVAFIACNGGTATPDQVIDAVWGGKAISHGTFLNRLTKTRRMLPGLLVTRAQTERELTLTVGVSTDLQLFETLVARSQRVSSGAAIELLRRALALIDGVPFDDASFDWAHQHQHHARACRVIEAATLRIVDLALEADGIMAARWACEQGLKAVPLNEPIYRARMRIEATAGNPDGLRDAYGSLRLELSHIDCDGGFNPDAETTRTFERLLASSVYHPAAR